MIVSHRYKGYTVVRFTSDGRWGAMKPGTEKLYAGGWSAIRQKIREATHDNRQHIAGRDRTREAVFS
jgi:hypothetical protein